MMPHIKLHPAKWSDAEMCVRRLR